jgi:hypothetical protein
LTTCPAEAFPRWSLTETLWWSTFAAPGLQQLGLDGTINTGPYENCGLWADELFAHPERPDGLLYPSRHDPSEACLALFERDDLVVTVTHDPIPLQSIMPQVTEALRRYGKGLESG